jgi:hypothetical protein
MTIRGKHTRDGKTIRKRDEYTKAIKEREK